MFFWLKPAFITAVALSANLPAPNATPHSPKTRDRSPVPIVQRGGEDVFITGVELARDDGAGRAGRVVKSFRRGDNPLHCLVTLSRAADGTRVSFVWSAIEAGDKRGETISAAEVVTRPREIVADGAMSLPRDWPVGRYKVQATVNGKSTKTIEFTID